MMYDAAIIISASRHGYGGRVLHHIAQRAPDPETHFACGFQARHARRALEDGAKTLLHI